jgi:glutamate dehydrogenase
VRERFEGAVRQHRLRREITATQMTNVVVDLLGMTFVHRSIRDTGATPVEVVRAALIAIELLDVRGFVATIEDVAVRAPAEAELQAYEAMAQAVDGVVRWMLLNDLTGADVERFVDAYRGPLAQVRAQLADLLPPPERRRFVRASKGFAALGLPQELATAVAGFEYVPSSMGVVEVARRTGASLTEAGTRFFALGERLRLGWLRDHLQALPADDKWAKIAQGGLVMDLRRAQQDLAERYVKARTEDAKLSVEAFLQRTPNVLRRYDEALREIVEDEALSLASAGVVVRLLAQAR